MSHSRSILRRLAPLVLLAVTPASAGAVTVHDDPAGFVAATGATSLEIPLAETLIPAFNVPGWGCDAAISIGFGDNEVTVTAPAAVPDPSVPGIDHLICIANAGVSGLDPLPVDSTIVANGEDDYELVFLGDVRAIGFEFLTNADAFETITFRDDLGSEVFALSADTLTDPNSFSFVGFELATPVRSVFVDTGGGASQNEGISAIFVSEVFDGDRDGSLPPDDCDDEDPATFPDAAERFDGADNDCDGEIDEELDDDGDGIPDFNDLCADTPEGSSVDPDGCPACVLEDPDGDGDGFPASVDCNDADPAIHPEAPELPGNAEDEDCDGEAVCDACADWDNHGAYVSCVAHAVRRVVDAGALDPIAGVELVTAAARSDVGKRGHVPPECGGPGPEPTSRPIRPRAGS